MLIAKEVLNVDVLLPAGGRVKGDFASLAGNEVKALIDFDGKSILERTLQAVRSIDAPGLRIHRVAVVGPTSTHTLARASGADYVLPETQTGSENILLGIDFLQSRSTTTDRILIMTTDMPFVTADSIQGFIARCPSDAQVCVPVVERECFEKIYPGLIRTDTHLSDGWFRLGGMFLVDANALLTNRVHLERVFEARKSNLKLAALIGLPMVLKYIARRLSSDDILQRAAQILQVSGAVIKGAPPEIGFDIDLQEEFEYAQKRFQDMR